LISRKADTEFTFDVDLALKQNDENPVFYVQYAHARIHSVRAQYAEKGGDLNAIGQADLSRLTADTELALMTKLAEFPGMLSLASQTLAPHDVAFYLRDLASAFHSYYAAERFLVDEVELSRARVALLSATAQVLRNGLSILGVRAPEKM
ncbi:MAG: arginine--tRNA ligase, partial [Burkholderiales bacterium]|nr:arginine--tRNA ligase [Burkholderiales bacterium]